MAKKIKEKKAKKQRKIKIFTIIMIIMDLLAGAGFFLAYGPWDYFRTMLVTTAMRTRSHQYLAYVLYNDEMINDVMSKNYFVKLTDSVNLDDIVIDVKKKDKYENEYEEAIYSKYGQADYNIINIEIGGKSGYLVAIYDPSKVKLIAKKELGTQMGERVITMCYDAGGAVCINGGGFWDEGYGSGIPLGYVVKDGKIIWSDGYDEGAQLIGFTKDDKLVLLEDSAENAIKNYGLRDALEFGPFLIVNGKPIEIHGDGGFGRAPRVAIGQRKDGIVLFLVVDATANYIDGIAIGDTVDTLLKYGAYNAANLDGGTSATLIVENQLYNHPIASAAATGGRYVVTGWAFIP